MSQVRMAAYECTSCREPRAWGEGEPASPEYMPWLSCGRCGNAQRHVFVKMGMFSRMEIDGEVVYVR